MRAPIQRLLLALPLLLCGACRSTAPASVDHSGLDSVLKACVRDGGVDYLVLRRDHRAALDAYLDGLASLSTDDVDALPRDDQLVLYLNLYNATVIAAVTDRIRADFTVAEDDFRLFKEPLVRLAGETMALDHLEHEIIRKRFTDPGVHAALVCGAQGCPALDDAALEAGGVSRALDSKMSEFLNDSAHNRVDADRRVVELSPLFQWYAQDFGGEGGLDAYAERYLGPGVKDFEVEFAEYDWSLNQAPPPPGHPWRAIARDEARIALDGGGESMLRRGELVEEIGGDAARARIRLGDGRSGTLDGSALETWDGPSAAK